MRLVEAVPAEGLDLSGDLLDHLLLVAALEAAGHEPAELLVDQLLDLLAHRLAQHVGLGQRVAGEDVGDAHHLLLIDDDAVGGLEDLLQLGERVAHRLLAALAADVDQVHPAVERPGAQQRVGGHEVVEPVAPHPLERVGREAGLELEDAGRPAAAEQRRTPAGPRGRACRGPRVTPCRSRIICTARCRTVRVVSPRKSIFSIPTFSRPTMSYCVMMASSLAPAPVPRPGIVHTGT